MEEEAITENNQNKKIPLSAAERKAKQREKEKLIQSGVYEAPLIEKAKIYIQENPELDLAAIYENELFKQKFNDQQKKQLKVFKANLKTKLKKECAHQIAKDQIKIDIREKAQRLGNQQIPLLHQSLLTPQTFEERRELIKQLIDENMYLFLEYMENYLSPTSDFLSIIIDLYQQFDIETSQKLFVRVCSMVRGETLKINQQMVLQAMQFLTETKIHNIAAYGLLRLVFQNDISFSKFPVPILQDFQTQYEQTILNFFKSIPQMKFQLNESIPPTCFCFTSPILKALKEGGDLLHKQIPFYFLPYIIEIICYSFTNDHEQFQKFLDVFKTGCKKLYEILLQSEIQNLLQEISERTKAMNPYFFKTLNNATQILEKSFELLKERKIEKFDQETILSLFDTTNESYQIIKQRPKILKETAKKVKEEILYNILQNNKGKDLDFSQNDSIINNEEKMVFKSLGISNLLPIQEFCYKFCTLSPMKQSLFIQYDTGQGKTSLCIALAAFFAKQEKTIFILNKSKELLFRDYKKATQISRLNNIKVSINENTKYSFSPGCQIIYSTVDNFINYFQDKNIQIKNEIICVIDEFDSILFQKYDQIKQLINILIEIKWILGFSGSKLEDLHKIFLEIQFKSSFLDFSLSQNVRIHPLCNEQLIFCNLKDFKDKIMNCCQKQAQFTPVVIIQNEYLSVIEKLLIQKGLSVDNLSEKEAQQIDSSLQFFNEKQSNGYQIFLINEEQGRGLDFVSSQEIEQNGGIFLIISCLPSYYLQYQQFLGRTGRIGCKGQYSIILYDKFSKNQNGQLYLSKKLKELQNNDLIFVTHLQQNQVKDNNYFHKIQSNENKEEAKDNQLNYFQQMEIQNNDNIQSQQSDHFINKIQLNAYEQIDYQMNDCSHDQIEFDKEIIQYSQNILKKRVNKLETKKLNKQNKKVSKTDQNKIEIDKQYFANYSDYKIHEEMLKDEVRMNSFENAINKIAKDQTIIDVGAGTGVLSMMAAKCGARKVYAIENSDIFYDAEKAINDNKLQNIITIINDKAENVELNVQKVDVVISEWMGYFLLYENMLPSVIHIRDKYLKEDGIIVPQRARLFLAGISKEQTVYGINMSSLGKNQFEYARIDICKEQLVITNSYTIFDFDLQHCNITQSKFESDFELEFMSEGQLNGFVGWFDIDLIDGIQFSTSPSSKETHWNQTLFYFKDPIKGVKEEKIIGKIKVFPNENNYRSLDLKITFKTPSMRKKVTKYFFMD